MLGIRKQDKDYATWMRLEQESPSRRSNLKSMMVSIPLRELSVSRWSVTVAPRHFGSLITPEELPIGDRVWEDTSIDLPEKAPTAWDNALTNKHGEGPRRLEPATVYEEFPIALLIGETR